LNLREALLVKASGARNVATLSAHEVNLKKRLQKHLSELGFRKTRNGALEISGTDKQIIRALHSGQRNDRLILNKSFIARNLTLLLRYFASGTEVDPSHIHPVLQRIRSETWESDLFRLASLTWAVPVSNGFGRRLRYLVWDGSNQKLIGLIAIGDPVFNLGVRDKLIGWDANDRCERLVNMMDAYVLGAVPPYNMLLGSKLIASLVRTREIYTDFTRTYGNTRGIISDKEKGARLLAVTTSSSLGRSSVYNRLRLGQIDYFRPIGYTTGWGHFHIQDDLFSDLRAFLRVKGHPYADLHRFGQGPNWRLRTTRTALEALGFKEEMLRHGIKREVFLCKLASNALDILRGGKGRPKLSTLLKADEVAEVAVHRWMLPRSERRPEFRAWTADKITELLMPRLAVIDDAKGRFRAA
jgi:hypothetical protein